MVIFQFIENKDAFEKCYKRFLAKRLVIDKSASDDAEASMISKLKQACGFDYTFKLQKVFQEVAVSKDFNERFKLHLKNTSRSLDIDFNIKVGALVVKLKLVRFSLP